MADIVTTQNDLKLVAAFADEDDRTLTLSNPQENITAAQIHSLESAAADVLIGDKFSAAFTRFKEAYYVVGTTTKLDLG